MMITVFQVIKESGLGENLGQNGLNLIGIAVRQAWEELHPGSEPRTVMQREPYGTFKVRAYPEEFRGNIQTAILEYVSKITQEEEAKKAASGKRKRKRRPRKKYEKI